MQVELHFAGQALRHAEALGTAGAASGRSAWPRPGLGLPDLVPTSVGQEISLFSFSVCRILRNAGENAGEQRCVGEACFPGLPSPCPSPFCGAPAPRRQLCSCRCRRVTVLKRPALPCRHPLCCWKQLCYSVCWFCSKQAPKLEEQRTGSQKHKVC